MTFARLYEFAYNLRRHPIILEGLVDSKACELATQDELWYIPCELDENISPGHIKQYREQPLPYAESKWVTEIRYSDKLNPCWQRYVCCKELMHVFDAADARVNCPERFRALLDEFEAPLPYDKQSQAYKSETETMWEALAILCPEPVRDLLRPEWEAGTLSNYEVALKLRIPEGLIKSAMSERFGEMLKALRPS